MSHWYLFWLRKVYPSFGPTKARANKNFSDVQIVNRAYDLDPALVCDPDFIGTGSARIFSVETVQKTVQHAVFSVLEISFGRVDRLV